MSKKQIVQDMLWKYSDTTIEIQGAKPIDFETHLICYCLFEFNDIGE
jgi:recombinational DNA repair protein RecT